MMTSGEASELARMAYRLAARDAAWQVLPVIIADMDSGEILHISPYAASIFGYEDAELLGQLLETLVPPGVADQHALWRQDTTVPKMRMMGQGRQVMGRRKDGTTFVCHVGLTATVVDGKQVGIAFVVDLTSVVQTATGLNITPSQGLPALKPTGTQESGHGTPTVSKVIGAILLLLSLTAILLALFWRSLVNGDSKSAEDLLADGLDQLRQGAYTTAVVSFREANKKGADPTLSLGGCAECLYYLKRDDESLAVIRELAAKVPNSGRANYLRGIVLERQGLLDAAKTQYELGARKGDRYALARTQRRS